MNRLSGDRPAASFGLPPTLGDLFFDITDLKAAHRELERALETEREAAERLRQADEMKTAFLTAVSHELRTPLTAILGNASLLERGDELSLSVADRRDLLRGLASKATQLSALVGDLLDTDRLARGVVSPRRRPTDIGSLVRRVVRTCDAPLDHHVYLDVREVTVPVDRAMVERIVENLLTNAVRYTPPGSTVWVRVAPAGYGALLVVEDDGPGVPNELKEALFEPFLQGPGVPMQSPGVGIGLSLVAQFAALHSGTAWVEDRPGGGASLRSQSLRSVRSSGPAPSP